MQVGDNSKKPGRIFKIPHRCDRRPVVGAFADIDRHLCSAMQYKLQRVRQSFG